MTQPDALERPFPGMEEAVMEVERGVAQTNLNALFEEIGDIFRIEADQKLSAIQVDPSTGERRLIAYDVVGEHETILAWDLNKRGRTKTRGTVFVNLAEYPEQDVAAFPNTKLGKSIKPDAKRYDDSGTSIPQNVFFEAARTAVTNQINGHNERLGPLNALTILQGMRANKYNYLDYLDPRG